MSLHWGREIKFILGLSKTFAVVLKGQSDCSECWRYRGLSRRKISNIRVNWLAGSFLITTLPSPACRVGVLSRLLSPPNSSHTDVVGLQLFIGLRTEIKPSIYQNDQESEEIDVSMRFLSALVTVVFSLEDLAGLAHSLSIAAEGDMEVTDRRSHMDLPLRGGDDHIFLQWWVELNSADANRLALRSDQSFFAVSTVSCWMDACKAACESRGERGICKYRCQPKLQRFDHCVTKCVCSETNVWPETFEGMDRA